MSFRVDYGNFVVRRLDLKFHDADTRPLGRAGFIIIYNWNCAQVEPFFSLEMLSRYEEIATASRAAVAWHSIPEEERYMSWKLACCTTIDPISHNQPTIAVLFSAWRISFPRCGPPKRCPCCDAQGTVSMRSVVTVADSKNGWKQVLLCGWANPSQKITLPLGIIMQEVWEIIVVGNS